MDSRQRQDLDNWITGHYGEDFFKDDEMEQDITITINVNMPRLDADILAEFLHEMIYDMMKIDAVVSYTIDAEGENQLPFVIEDKDNE